MEQEHDTSDPIRGAAPARRVLLVEDDAVNLEIGVQTLEDAGFEVISAQCGLEAVRLAQSGRPDLILMDLRLPDIDGFEATRRIRSFAPGVPQVPIVALTGTIYGRDREDCREAGMDGCEEKPLTPELLRRLTAMYLSRREAAVAATSSLPAGLSHQHLRRLFDESAGRLIAELRSARDRPDRQIIERVAHTLKSSSARLGFMRLSGACATLESLVRDNAASLGPAIESVLNAYQESQADAAPSADSPAAGRAPAIPAGPLVLIVDDEENERFLVRRTLEQAGYRVAECEGGQEALAFCRETRPAAVLLDGLMPGMDGVATCTALRMEPHLSHLPILMYTGLADPSWRARATAAGADCFVNKTVGIADLQRSMLEQLAALGVLPAAAARP